MKKNIVSILIVLSIFIVVYYAREAYYTTDIANEKDPSAPLLVKSKSLWGNANAIDERTTIEKAMKHQKEILKPSFITDEFQHKTTDTTYDPYNDTYDHRFSYTYPEIISTISLSVSNKTSSIYDEFFKSPNTASLPSNVLDGVYGISDYYNEERYFIAGEDTKGSTYIVEAGGPEEGYTLKFMEKIADTMTEETNGGYNPFYDNFNLDLNKIGFPAINPRRADIFEVKLSTAEEGIRGTIVSVIYTTTEDDLIDYTIKDQESLWLTDSHFKKIGEEKTNGGQLVTEFTDEMDGRRYFYWTDGMYHYELTSISYLENDIDTNDLLLLIDSAMTDKRSFKNMKLFETDKVESKHSDDVIEINRMMKQLKSKY